MKYAVGPDPEGRRGISHKILKYTEYNILPIINILSSSSTQLSLALFSSPRSGDFLSLALIVT